jgi:alpha-L-rhamnosidase
VQHNLLWGQATNLMMVPTDCDQRDERFGWTGDSALTSEEALSNFDLGAFYHNWCRFPSPLSFSAFLILFPSPGPR